MRAGLSAFVFFIASAAVLGAACTSLEGLSGTAPPDGGDDSGTTADAASCSADLSSDIDNCGTCGNRCAVRANGFPACERGACVTKCNAGFGDCDTVEANGCEATLTADGKNCGVCGRDCRGTTCSAGACAPKVLAQSQQGPYGMAIDATSIYWAAWKSSEIWSCTKPDCTGGPRRVTSASGSTYFVSVDASNVYFNSNSGNTMYRAPIDGTPTATAIVSASSPTLNIVDEGFLYWTGNGGDARRVRVAVQPGATPQNLTLALTDPVGLAIDGTTLYVTQRNPGKVVYLPKTGGTPTELMTVQGAQAIAVDASGIYVGSSTGEIKRFAGGVTTTFASGPGPVGFAIVLTKDEVFWTVNSANGSVMAASKSTGVVRTIVAGVATPAALVVDDTAIYWTSEDDGTVTMIPR